jgi:hypothetical protein
MRLVVALAAFVVLALPAAAAAGKLEPPKVEPIVANFKQEDFATYYTVDVTPAAGRPYVHVAWSLAPPKEDPGCKKFKTSATTQEAAVWNHGDEDGCDHTKMGARGHMGTVHLLVTDGVFTCKSTYSGSISGTGAPVTCENVEIGYAIERVSVAAANENYAIDDIQKGRKWKDAIDLAKKQLEQGKEQALKGGAPEAVTKLIDEASAMDSTALGESGKKAIGTLEAAVKVKQKAIKLLKALPRTG